MVDALLLSQKIIPEEIYQQRLHALFSADPENEILLALEWEMDFKQAIALLRISLEASAFDCERFGRLLMQQLKKFYMDCSDITAFTAPMYDLWRTLPWFLQDKQPFWALSYLDEPLSWGDEKQTRQICREMLNYYQKNLNQ